MKSIIVVKKFLFLFLEYFGLRSTSFILFVVYII